MDSPLMSGLDGSIENKRIGKRRKKENSTDQLDINDNPFDSFSPMLDSLTDPVLIVSESGEILFANSNFEKITGCERTHLLHLDGQFPFFFQSKTATRTDITTPDDPDKSNDRKHKITNSTNNNQNDTNSTSVCYEQLFFQFIHQCIESNHPIYSKHLELHVTSPSPSPYQLSSSESNNNSNNNNNNPPTDITMINSEQDNNNNISCGDNSENTTLTARSNTTGAPLRKTFPSVVSFFPSGGNGSRNVYCLFKESSEENGNAQDERWYVVVII